jgi:protein-disulfide isomerase
MGNVRKGFALVLFALLAAATLSAQEHAPERDRCVGTNPQAPVVMEVFSDHECPACRRFYLEVTRQVLSDYALKGRVCVIYHDFPLRIHKHAREAARYSQVAADLLTQQDWIRVTDALYYHQQKWAANGEVESFVADALGEEKMKKVRQAVADPKVEKAIDQELAVGRSVGVKGTPTVLITANGKTERIPAGTQYSMLRRYFDYLLAQAR